MSQVGPEVKGEGTRSRKTMFDSVETKYYIYMEAKVQEARLLKSVLSDCTLG